MIAIKRGKAIDRKGKIVSSRALKVTKDFEVYVRGVEGFRNKV